MNKTLSFLALLVLLLAVVPAFQNWEPVPLRFFFWTLSVNASLLILLCWLLGAITARPLYRLFKSWLKARGSKDSSPGTRVSGGSPSPAPPR